MQMMKRSFFGLLVANMMESVAVRCQGQNEGILPVLTKVLRHCGSVSRKIETNSPCPPPRPASTGGSVFKGDRVSESLVRFQFVWLIDFAPRKHGINEPDQFASGQN